MAQRWLSMFRVIGLSVLIIALAVVAGIRCSSDDVTGPGEPAGFQAELEGFVDSYDDEQGGSLIKTQGCSEASGGMMVKGMDYPGEWIEVPITVPESGNYEVILQYATLAGDSLEARLTFKECGVTLNEPEVDFILDQGRGLG